MSPALAGSPELPFRTRYNLSCSAAAALSGWITLAVVVALLVRLPSPSPHALFLRLDIALVLADMLWRRRCQSTCDGGSYARWREAVPLLLIANHALLGSGDIARAWLDQVSEAQGGRPAASLARHAGLLLYASRCMTTAILWFNPKRIGMALPAHLLMALAFARHNADACSSAALAAPAAARLTHRIAQALDAVRFWSFPLPPPLLQPASGSDAECRAVLAYCQLVLGVAVPALVQACLEARLFAAHAEQRARAGLPPERGWQAALGRAVHDVLRDLDWLTTATLLWVLLGVLQLAAQALAYEALPA